MRPRHPANGFTLIELLVVIAIIGVLVALLLPAVQKVREAANRTKCQNNLKQLALACLTYDLTHRWLPPATIGTSSSSDPYATWAVLVLPWIEQGNLYGMWSLPDLYSKQAKDMVQAKVNVFFCPTRRQPMISTSGYATQYGMVADYVGCGGYGTDADTSDPAHHGVIIDATNVQITSGKWVSCRGQVSSRDIPDGTSNTFLLGEKHITPDVLGQTVDYGDGSVYDHYWGRYSTRVAGPANPLHEPTDNCKGVPTNCYRSFGSWHSGMCQFAFVDGHVLAVANSTDPNILRLLAVRDDGQVIPPY